MPAFVFLAAVVSEEGIYSGKIVIKSKNSQFKVTLPYHAQVLKGQLPVSEESTHFHLETEEMTSEIVRYLNTSPSNPGNLCFGNVKPILGSGRFSEIESDSNRFPQECQRNQ